MQHIPLPFSVLPKELIMVETEQRRTLGRGSPSEFSIVNSEVEMRALGRGSEMSETRAGSSATQSFDSNLPPPTPERAIYKFVFFKPYSIAFSFLITFLIGVLQVTNKSNDASSFAAHPANMWVFIIATVIYSFAFATTLALPPDTSNSLLAGFIAFFSGALSAISVIWMFLPLWLGWLMFVMWFLLLVMVGCDLCRHSFQILYQKCEEKLHDTLNRLMEHNLTEQQHVPV